MPQFYPAHVDVNWSEVVSPSSSVYNRLHHWQNRLDIVADTYRIQSNACQNSNSNTKFRPIVQTNGNIDVDDEEWTLIMPPSKTQQVLCYLPLCYGTDGIFYYTFENMFSPYTMPESEVERDDQAIHVDYDDVAEYDRNVEYFTRGLINRYTAQDEWEITNQYTAVKNANAEIQVIGNILNDLQWSSNDTMTLMPDASTVNITSPSTIQFDISAFDPSGGISTTHDGYYEGYEGYIECSIYSGNSTKYFMMLNRRGEFPLTSFVNANDWLIPDWDEENEDTDRMFEVADDQRVRFETEQDISDDYALVDMYDGESYYFSYDSGEDIYFCNITFTAGEAKLLKLVSIDVPSTINQSSYTLSNVHIDHNVTILDDASLTIQNNVTIDDNVTITVEDEASLFFTTSGSITKFGTNSEIDVDGQLYVSNATLSGFDTWAGIDCNSGGEVYIQNGGEIIGASIGVYANDGSVDVDDSNFENCLVGIALYNGSDLTFDSSTMLLKNDSNAKGIMSTNYSSTENSVSISGTVLEPSIIKGSDANHSGLYVYSLYENTSIDFECEYTNFLNLSKGISHNSTVSTDHVIQYCNFEDCDYGIDIFGNGGRLHTVTNCEFTDCEIGIALDTATSDILNSTFTDCDYGIDFQNASVGFGTSLKADNCEFDSVEGDVRCSDSSPRIINSEFSGKFGIMSMNSANVGIQTNAYNLFQNTDSHLAFLPDRSTLSSGILMGAGHNDFYDCAQYMGSDSDMHFSGYDGSNITIDANENWFEDDSVDKTWTQNTTLPTIYDSELDPDPNVRGNDRFSNALFEENNGNYNIALNSFYSILNDQLESEAIVWDKCIDKVFNLSMYLEQDIHGLLQYYNNLFETWPEYLSNEQIDILNAIVLNYKKKCFIVLRNYQDAADIVFDRINNAVNPIDSLYAVMQLETIYSLSLLDSTRNTLRTSFDPFAPRTVEEKNKLHQKHWREIYTLLGMTGEETGDPIISPQVVLFNNYPNPFNPITTLKFSIPEDSKVAIEIYNVKGQKVRTLINDDFEKGIHEIVWNSTDTNNKNVASGVYFYKLNVNGKNNGLKKMLLLK